MVMVRSRTLRTGVTHDTRGAPSTSTVQQPHCPCGLHPSLTEMSRSSSRKTSSSVAVLATAPSTVTERPLTTRAMDCVDPIGVTLRRQPEARIPGND